MIWKVVAQRQRQHRKAEGINAESQGDLKAEIGTAQQSADLLAVRAMNLPEPVHQRSRHHDETMIDIEGAARPLFAERVEEVLWQALPKNRLGDKIPALLVIARRAARAAARMARQLFA